MADDLDRTDVWDHNKAADGLFGSEGGMAIWVRRKEAAPRSAVRNGTTDFTEVLTELGALKLGLDQLVEAVAQRLSMDVKDVRTGMDLAANVISQHASACARTRTRATGGD